ncbi:MAG: class I SAM-dependent methyltransferase [Ktedonobacterales bacterium]
MRWFSRKRAAKNAVADAPTSRSLFSLGGRSHLANAPYMLPKDDLEINRLDFQHYMLRYALRGNYAAPLRAPASILDVGCGTGRWALEMARLYPQANVVGVDLVAPAIESGEKPENFAFVQGNVLEENGLPFGPAAFDYVHQRFLFAAIPADHWPQVVRELARVTRPGGWVELVEGATMSGDAPAFTAIQRWVMQASERRGIDFKAGAHVTDFLRQAGLAHINQREVAIPLGQYGGRLGVMMETDFFSAVSGLRGPVMAMRITSADEFDQAMQTARREMATGRFSWTIHIAWGERGR